MENQITEFHEYQKTLKEGKRRGPGAGPGSRILGVLLCHRKTKVMEKTGKVSQKL